MLINISNHLSSAWGEVQLQAAAAIGGVEDVAFPAVDAAATGSEVSALADRYCEDIASRYDAAADTVHVMGEMTFTYSLVRRLRAAGFRCVASTTERVKRQQEDGTFVSEFKFNQFRDYE